MTFDFWKKTGLIRPFSSVSEYEQYEKDCLKVPTLDMFANTALRKSKVKKGVNGRSEKFDSFFEYTFVQYMRGLKGYIVERNHRTRFLTYIDPAGKTRKFYPDFIVNGNMYEVKGYFSAKDRCKMEQHPDVTWCFSSDIELMRHELNIQMPDWKDDFTQLN